MQWKSEYPDLASVPALKRLDQKTLECAPTNAEKAHPVTGTFRDQLQATWFVNAALPCPELSPPQRSHLATAWLSASLRSLPRTSLSRRNVYSDRRTSQGHIFGPCDLPPLGRCNT
jgi:hypothetical protein